MTLVGVTGTNGKTSVVYLIEAIANALTMGGYGDIPVIGDWNADGKDDIGVRRGVKFLLDANGNGRWNGTGDGLDVAFVYKIGETSFAGDWNGDGQDQVGTHAVRLFHLDYGVALPAAIGEEERPTVSKRSTKV